MSTSVSTFTAPPDVVIELGSVTPNGLVYLKNLGPNVVWVGSHGNTIPPNEGTVSPGSEPGGIPLCPGDSVKVQVPEYPVLEGTVVPAVVSIATGSKVAFSVEGS